MMATSINYEGLPPVAPEFDAAALRANILDSQRHNQPYREFTRRGPCRTGHRVLGIGGRLQRPHRRPADRMVPRRRTVGAHSIRAVFANQNAFVDRRRRSRESVTPEFVQSGDKFWLQLQGSISR
jgi:hypothetical protein